VSGGLEGRSERPSDVAWATPGVTTGVETLRAPPAPRLHHVRPMTPRRSGRIGRRPAIV